jgi:transcriptional regulator with XRE-family HTH domain
MSATGSPTARRRELGYMLRSFRLDAGLTTEEVADRLGVSRSKVSRLENGRRGAGKADIARLCEIYQVDDEGRLRLAELAAGGKERAWWQRLNLRYGDYVGLESEAESISDYGLAIVPGLLQTPDYARALVRAGGPTLPSGVVEERVQARVTRQRILSSAAVPALVAVLDESVLHRVVGSPGVMLEQMRKLLEISRLPNVTIRVVPFDAGVVHSVNKFIILRFALADIPDIVFVEDIAVDRYLEDRHEVEAYSATFQRLVDMSADADASRAMILAKFTAYDLRTR